MTDFSPLLVADRRQPARILHRVTASGFEAWLKDQPQRSRTAVAAQRFKGEPGSLVILAGDKVDEWNAAFGAGETPDPWDLAHAAAKLPEGLYRLAGQAAPGPAALGWLLAQHRFDRYRSAPEPRGDRVLLTPDAGADRRDGAAGRGGGAGARSGRHRRRRHGPGRAGRGGGRDRPAAQREGRRDQGRCAGERLPDDPRGRPRGGSAPRAAPDRAGMGRSRASAHRDRRQGRLLRFGRARHQARCAACC